MDQLMLSVSIEECYFMPTPIVLARLRETLEAKKCNFSIELYRFDRTIMPPTLASVAIRAQERISNLLERDAPRFALHIASSHILWKGGSSVNCEEVVIGFLANAEGPACLFHRFFDVDRIPEAVLTAFSRDIFKIASDLAPKERRSPDADAIAQEMLLTFGRTVNATPSYPLVYM